MEQCARIILADDDPIMRELAQAKLLEAGYEACVFADGDEAFEALKRDGADLVISDIEMPNLDGFELTRKIRADKKLCETPVIVITSTEASGAVDEAFASGANSFLSKPINWSLFNHSVRFVLRASESEKALRVARDQAEAGARFKDNLMSVMSHELRTPLNAIIGFGQIIGEHFDKSNDIINKEYTDYILESGKRLLNSVSDMLLASEARAGLIAINETDVTVGDVMTDALAPLEKLISISGAEVVLRLENPDVEICCDRALLARALGKLVDNSIKFAQRGVRIVIGTAMMPSGDLAFLVKDNGPGVAVDKMEEVITPFAQPDMSAKRSKEGLGLGLPLTHAIAQAHQAIFKLDSKPSSGAEAIFVLPAARVRSAGKPTSVKRSA